MLCSALAGYLHVLRLPLMGALAEIPVYRGPVRTLLAEAGAEAGAPEAPGKGCVWCGGGRGLVVSDCFFSLLSKWLAYKRYLCTTRRAALMHRWEDGEASKHNASKPLGGGALEHLDRSSKAPHWHGVSREPPLGCGCG